MGLDLYGRKEVQIKEMRRLCDQLDIFMKSKSSLQFIDTASVPVIKLKIDLRLVNKKLIKYGEGSSTQSMGES